MNAGRGARPVTLVSRLAWAEPSDLELHGTVAEVPHVRGVPMTSAALDPNDVTRRRCWPNRAGILERGGPADTVDWYADLAEEPPNGRSKVHRGPTPGDLAQRLTWFRTLLKSLSQIRGVTVPVRPEAPCGIVLTRGVAASTMVTGSQPFLGAIDVLPERLGEFPGGIQLVVTGEAWLHADAYAVTVQNMLKGKG